ncbi:MAG: hypothetical protein FWC73_14490, partial [Defluviitaleaceae bacterium]|nr:hypothetical protein [Defluviitaleaceae bacterium]
NCVTYALDTSGMYDYWRQGVRELTQPGRNKQITALVENYTFPEIYARVLHYRPCMLPQFHNLGFFLDISADDLTAMGRGQSAANAIIIKP